MDVITTRLDAGNTKYWNRPFPPSFLISVDFHSPLLLSTFQINGYCGSFPGVKQLAYEVLNSPPSIPKLKLSGGIPLLSQFIFTALTGTTRTIITASDRPANVTVMMSVPHYTGYNDTWQKSTDSFCTSANPNMILSRQNTEEATADRHAWLWTFIVFA